MPVWLKEKLYLKSVLKKELAQLGDCKPDQLPPLLFAEPILLAMGQEADVAAAAGDYLVIAAWALIPAWL